MPRHPEIRSLDLADLTAVLALFEEAWTAEEGDELSSEDFYSRYRTGEFDSTFGMAWATYYEAWLRTGEGHRPELESLLSHALPPVAVG